MDDVKDFVWPVLSIELESMNSVPVPDVRSGKKNVDVMEKIHEAANTAFKDGKNVIIYPSGHLAGQGKEKIFNKRSAHEVVRVLPDNVQVIGLRIRGLWGSSWSRAWNGRTPDFFPTFIRGTLILFANLFFFVPRRKVTFEFIDITREAKGKAQKDRTTFNNFLEDFYNEKGEEEVTYIKYYFFAPPLKRKLPDRIQGA